MHSKIGTAVSGAVKLSCVARSFRATHPGMVQMALLNVSRVGSAQSLRVGGSPLCVRSVANDVKLGGVKGHHWKARHTQHGLSVASPKKEEIMVLAETSHWVGGKEGEMQS